MANCEDSKLIKKQKTLGTLQLQQNLKKTTKDRKEWHYSAPDNDIHIYSTLHRQETLYIMCTSHFSK